MHRLRIQFPTLPVVALCLLLAPLGCDLLGEGDEDAEGFSGGPVIAATVGGEERSVWLFSPKTLNRVAILEATDGHFPKGLAFSPDNERWYLSWSIGSQLDGDLRNVIAAYDPSADLITKRDTTDDLSVGGSPLVYDPTSDYVVAYNSGDGPDFIDPETLELRFEATFGPEDPTAGPVAVAEKRGTLYFGTGTEVQVYDPVSREVAQTFRPTDAPGFRENVIEDMALSPDEGTLYATTFSLTTGGIFSAVALDSMAVVAEHQAGGDANLAVAPDGNAVFVDSPAGGLKGELKELTPTNQVLRYDTETREMDVFIDGPGEIGLGLDVLIADLITMLPNEEAFVIRNAGAAQVRLDDDRKVPSLIKVDTRTGDVLATHIPPPEDRGVVASSVQRLLRYGILPK